MEKHLFKKIESPLGYITVDPKPSATELREYYQAIYYQSQESIQNTGYENSYSDVEIAFRDLHSELIIYSIETVLLDKSPNTARDVKNFFEIGCGEGFLLDAAFRKGWTVKGLDFNSYAINKFNPHLLNHVTFGDIYEVLDAQLSSNQDFDICVMQNVLEHVVEPELLLQKLKSLMRPDSLIMFIVPNDYSPLQLKALELGLVEEEFWWAPPDHLNYFNIENGIKLAHSLGFKVKDVFSTFPIDFFLFHSGSNYYKNRRVGKEAHFGRIRIELLLAEAGIEKYHAFCQALANCNLGRNFALILSL